MVDPVDDQGYQSQRLICVFKTIARGTFRYDTHDDKLFVCSIQTLYKGDRVVCSFYIPRNVTEQRPKIGLVSYGSSNWAEYSAMVRFLPYQKSEITPFPHN